MLRRFLPLTSLAVLSTFTPRADAAGAFLSGGATAPMEQRVAIAVAPERVTLWTSARLDPDAGPFGVVVPVPPGASLDHSTDAWFEALEAATSPRIFPPAGVSPYCPGTEGPADPFQITANLDEGPGLLPLESVLLDSPGAVSLWAAKHGLTLAPETATALETMSGMRFFAERFEASGGTTMTSTLRVVIPGGKPVLPLALTRAGFEDLHVTAWLIGPGRGSLQGAEQISLPVGALRWKAGAVSSTFLELRAAELASKGADAVLLEASSHEALAENVSIANGKASIPGAMIGFFERAATYGDSGQSPSSCIVSAAAALNASSVVAMSCPRADLGVVDGADTCTESPASGQTDPAMLRCGGRTDDLAVALSGMSPSATWLTRRSMVVPKGASGAAWSVSFASGAPVAPVLVASSIDLATCDWSSGSGSGASGAGAGPSGPSGAGAGPSGNPTGGFIDYGPAYDDDADVGCGCTSGAVEPIIDGAGGWGGAGGAGGAGGGDDGSYYDSSSDDCSGDTSDGYEDSSDDCSGDTSDGYEDSSDDCSGDTSDGYEDSSSDDCSGDTDDGYEDSSSDDCEGDTSEDSSSDDCEGDTGDGDDGWTSEETSGDAMSSDSSTSACTVATHRTPPAARKRGPKLSMLTLGLLAILAPLRRMRRPDRTPRNASKRTSRA
jgi:hypothetical protein